MQKILDMPPIWNGNLYYRLLRYKYLPTSEQIRSNNNHSLRRCNELLRQGEVVNIYPTGRICDALTSPWYGGIGDIVKQMTEADRDSVMIVPFRFDTFSVMRLVRALHSYRYSTHIPQKLYMRIGRQGTANQLLGSAIDTMSAKEVSEILRLQFIKSFASK